MVLFIDAVDEMLSEKGLGFVTNIINIAFIVLLAILITKGVRRLMQNSHRITGDPVKQKRAETAETLMASIIKYVTYFIAAALIASELGFGASVRSLLAAAGIGGIVIGIGAQSLISDIVNGFFFLFEDQFSVGDMIDAGGITGTVESIGLRTTTVRAFTGEVSVIPNGSIRTLTNYSRTNSLAIVDIPVALSADADAVHHDRVWQPGNAGGASASGAYAAGGGALLRRDCGQGLPKPRSLRRERRKPLCKNIKACCKR